MDAKFDEVYIDTLALNSPLAVRAKELFSPSKIRVVDKHPYQSDRGNLSAGDFSKSKRRLWISPYKGQFFKRCPGSRPGLMCCNYFVLNWGSQCDMNCSYCYLQSFVNSKVTTLYSNIDQALEELRAIGHDQKDKKIRIGTGETVDSLSMDELTQHSKTLIEFFKDYPNWTLEFKTKSNCVDQFLDSKHSGNVVVSWSINPPYIIEREEHLTASFLERLNAAELCLKKGFQIAFHIDPMIFHEGWETNYNFLVDEITKRFTPDQVNVISIGSLRFQPEQRHLMKERFHKTSLVNTGELFKSRDGKLRYDSNLRSKMFSQVLNRFKSNSDQWKVFLCMETPETWAHIDKKNPFKDEGIKDLFTPIRIKRPEAERPPSLQ